LERDANFTIHLRYARKFKVLTTSHFSSAYPNCPYLGGTCPNIHVDEDIPASELQATVAHQLGAGYQPNGEHMQHPKTNGHTPRPEAPRAPETKAPKLKVAKSEETVPLCKFAAGCTKPDCPFAHPTPAAGQEGLVLRGEMCPDGRDCLNREVLYFTCSPLIVV